MTNRNPSALVAARAKRQQRPPRTAILRVRLTPEELQLLDEKAKRVGHTRTDLARCAIFRYKVKDLSPETLELRKHFIRALGNLNQLMRYLNTNGYSQEVVGKALQVVDYLHELRRAHNML